MKKIFLENLATKVMALFLAVLTWVYLFAQGNGTAEIDVAFQPQVLDPQVFASVTYRDAKGQELVPGGPLRVRLSGPKGIVSGLSIRPSRHYGCKFSVETKDLDKPQGSLKLELRHSYFDLPTNVTVEPLTTSQITLEYVKYLDKEIELVPNPLPWEGDPREGYRVDLVTILPTHIKAKVPADLPGSDKVPIRSVPASGRFESFTLERWELEPGSRILPQTPFRAEIRIVAVPATRRLPLDVHLTAKDEIKARVKVDTKTVTVELQGPKELIEGAPESAFAAYVIVTEADVATPGPKNINLPALGCHVLDPKYLGKVTVILMPDVTPENRQVKITVLPK